MARLCVLLEMLLRRLERHVMLSARGVRHLHTALFHYRVRRYVVTGKGNNPLAEEFRR